MKLNTSTPYVSDPNYRRLFNSPKRMSICSKAGEHPPLCTGTEKSRPNESNLVLSPTSLSKNCQNKVDGHPRWASNNSSPKAKSKVKQESGSSSSQQNNKVTNLVQTSLSGLPKSPQIRTSIQSPKINTRIGNYQALLKEIVEKGGKSALNKPLPKQTKTKLPPKSKNSLETPSRQLYNLTGTSNGTNLFENYLKHEILSKPSLRVGSGQKERSSSRKADVHKPASNLRTMKASLEKERDEDRRFITYNNINLNISVPANSTFQCVFNQSELQLECDPKPIHQTADLIRTQDLSSKIPKFSDKKPPKIDVEPNFSSDDESESSVEEKIVPTVKTNLSIT